MQDKEGSLQSPGLCSVLC